jgi:hypothetical protein
MASITLNLNDNEQQVLTSLLDAAVKQIGLPSAVAVAYFLQKITTAQTEAVLTAEEEMAAVHSSEAIPE